MIRITTGYRDLLNLYGDYSNISLLARYLTELDLLVETDSFSAGSYINLMQHDLLYLGAGTERRMLRALSDFKRYQAELHQFCEKGGFVFATGNAIALLGKTVVDSEGNSHEAAGLLDLDVRINRKRSYSELIAKTPLTENLVVGNINSSIMVESREQPLFQIVSEAPAVSGKTEGAIKNTVVATQLSGPLLVRNPALLHAFAEKVSDKKLPELEASWVSNAKEGYQRALLKLEREMKG